MYSAGSGGNENTQTQLYIYTTTHATTHTTATLNHNYIHTQPPTQIVAWHARKDAAAEAGADAIGGGIAPALNPMRDREELARVDLSVAVRVRARKQCARPRMTTAVSTHDHPR